MGKSRVIAAAIVLKHLYDKTRSFTIVFTTDLLKSVDEKVYTQLRTLLAIEVALVVYSPKVLLAGQIGKGFVIIDEADQILLDNA